MLNLRTVSNLFLDHWKLKLLAVLLATVAWLVSYGRDYTTLHTYATLKMEAPRGGVILSAGNKNFVDEFRYSVELYGPRNKIEQLERRRIIGHASFADVTPADVPAGQARSVTVSLDDRRILELPQGFEDVEVRGATPARLDVRIDKLVEVQVPVKTRLEYVDENNNSRPVRLNTGDGCIDGYQVTDFTSVPRIALVRIPQSAAKLITSVDAQPARIDHLDRRIERIVRLLDSVDTPDYGRVPIECIANCDVVVSVEVAERLQQRTLKDVPIRTLRPAKFWPIVEIKAVDGKPVDSKDPKIDLVVEGRGSRVEKIAAEDADVRAFLDVSGLNQAIPGLDVEKPLTVTLPEGVRLAGKTPVATYEVKPTVTVD